MNLEETKKALANAGITISFEKRLGNDTGT